MAREEQSTAKSNDIGMKAQPFVNRIERLLVEKKEFCQGCAEDIKGVYEEAKEDGLPVKALRRIIRLRKLERDIEALPAKLDMDEAAQFAALAEAFGNTPFGEHAAARSIAAAVKELRNGGAEVSVSPAKERPDEEYLSRIGRGSGDAAVVDELAP